MYSERSLIHIVTILECIEKIWIYSSKYKSAHEFIWADKQLPLNGVINLFIAIGEESKKIELNLKKSVESDFNWKNVAGIRDKLAHDYRGVDEKVLWNSIKNELPKLKESLIEMIKLVNPPEELLNEILNTPYYEDIQYLKI